MPKNIIEGVQLYKLYLNKPLHILGYYFKELFFFKQVQ